MGTAQLFVSSGIPRTLYTTMFCAVPEASRTVPSGTFISVVLGVSRVSSRFRASPEDTPIPVILPLTKLPFYQQLRSGYMCM